MESKRLGLLHELIPHAKLIAVLINPSQPAAAAQGDEVAAAARALGLRVSIVYASSQGELDNAVAACVQMGVGGLVVTADALFFNRQKEIVNSRHVMPYRPSTNGVTSSGPAAWRATEAVSPTHFTKPASTQEKSLGSQSNRSACCPNDQIRVRHQFKDGKDAWH